MVATPMGGGPGSQPPGQRRGFPGRLRDAGPGGAQGPGRGGAGHAGPAHPLQYSLLLPLSSSDTARVSDLAAGAGIARRRPAASSTRSSAARSFAARARGGTAAASQPRSPTTGARRWASSTSGCAAASSSLFDGLPGEEQTLVSDLLVRLAALIDELSSARPTDAVASQAPFHKRSTRRGRAPRITPRVTRRAPTSSGARRAPGRARGTAPVSGVDLGGTPRLSGVPTVALDSGGGGP